MWCSGQGRSARSAVAGFAKPDSTDRDRRADLLRLGKIAGHTRPGGSSWQSLQRGTGDVETDYLNGEMVLLGRMHGVPAPANQLLQQLTRELAVNRDAPGPTPAAPILERIETARKLTGRTSG
jgi:2-dehydropantoate 2-reductase